MSEERDLGAWGVDPGYHDYAGNWRPIPATTVQQVLGEMGAAAPVPAHEAPLVATGQHGPWPDWPAGQLELEDGRRLGTTADGWPTELPYGYHRLTPDDGSGTRVVAVCPDQCPAPPAGRTWGWAAQLYAVRTAQSWGIGDYGDLRRLVHWAGGQGAGFVLVNPLHAPNPGPGPAPSPYSPSSRCFYNPVHLDITAVPGADQVPGLEELQDRARRLNADRLVDRAKVWDLKSQALEAIFCLFEKGGRDESFEAFIAERGPALDGYTTFCALSEKHGLPWQSWPDELRDPSSSAVGRFAGQPAAQYRKRFFAWLQWLCEAQLEDVGGPGLMCDLAVGVDSGGADAWLWQEVFDLGMRVGAPPDEFNTKGQDWGLPPWDPWKLRAAAYEPYIQTLRSSMRFSRGLRVDHVMGLFRLFWVPEGADAADGAYVRYMWQEMVGLLRLEAWRAGTYVVGEDLGTVEDHVRHVLGHSGVLSYRIFWFEPEPPSHWPSQALGAVTTHDLPTVAGVWTGADVQAQRNLGLPLNEESCGELRERVKCWTGVADGASSQEVVEAVYKSLGQAPCALLTAVLDDACAVEERPNMPGTTDQWPNWCLALPVPLEDLEKSSLAASIAASLNGP